MSIQVPEDDFPCCAPVTPTSNREELDALREAIAREYNPKIFDASRWYPGPEQRYSISQMFGRIGITLNSEAFSDWLASRLAVARAEGAAEALKQAATLAEEHSRDHVPNWEEDDYEAGHRHAADDLEFAYVRLAAEYCSAVTNEKEQI